MTVQRVHGTNQLILQLKADKRAKAAGLERGLAKAGLVLLGMSMKLVPVHTGVLRASGNTIKEGSGFATEVVISYGTAYGVYVHENLEAAHGQVFNEKYAAEIASGVDPSYYFDRGPDQQAKFLEQPMREHEDDFRALIRTEMLR